MRSRHLAAAAATAIVLAACTGSSAPVVASAAPEPVLLTYTYVTGAGHVYDLTQSQHVTVEADGDPAALAVAGVELPLSAVVDSSAATALSYTVADGPEEGTHEVTVHAAFPDVSVEGTVNGEPFDRATDELGLGDMAPVDFTVVVDDQGRIVEVPGASGVGGGHIAGLGSGPGPGPVMSRPLGPSFPEDRPLTVGDTWTEESSEELPDGSTVAMSATHEVVSAEELDGVPVLVIESTYSTGAATIDLGAIFADMASRFADLASGVADAPPASGLRFSITLDPSTSTATTWFDPAAGTVRKATTTGTTTTRMDVAGEGEAGSVTIDITIDSETTYELHGQATES